MKQILLIALMAVTMITSCNTQDVINNENGDTMNVSLKVTQAPISKSVGGQSVVTGSKTAIEKGTLYFFNSSGTVVYKYTLDITGVDAGLADGGTIIKDVPSTASTVAMIANSAQDFSSSTPTTFAEFKAISFNIWNQASMAGNVGNLSVNHPNAVKGIALLDDAGSNTVANTITKAVGGSYNATAIINLTPAVSRIEIPANGIKIATVDDVENPIKLTAFNLVGVYINNFYLTRSLSLSSSLLQGTTGNNWASTFNDVDGYKALATSVSPAVTMFDEFSLGKAITTSGGNDFLAYHVMPASGAANLPHIIIAGKDFVLDGNAASTPVQYWKVTSYIYANDAAAVANGESSGTTTVGVFQPAKVYVVSGITFGKNYPRDEPYEDNLTVQVTLTVKDWTNIPIIAEPK